jgi:hypothetical protein
MVELLLKSGAVPNNVNKHGLTPLAATSIEMNAELGAIYQHVYGSLGLNANSMSSLSHASRLLRF